MIKKPGATGNFPQGKVKPEDEGELVIGIGIKDGIIMLEFGKPTAWIGFGPNEARTLAAKLSTLAAKLEQ